MIQFLLLNSCDMAGDTFVVNQQTRAAFATGRSAVRKLFINSQVSIPYDIEFLRTVHRSIKLQTAIFAVKQAPPLGCFDLRKIIVALFQVGTSFRNRCDLSVLLLSFCKHLLSRIFAVRPLKRQRMSY